MKLIGAVEHKSNHPIAKAIVDKVKFQDIELEVNHVENMPGYGIKAVVHGYEVIVASSTYFEKHGLYLPKKALKQEGLLKNAGKTVMVVYVDGIFAGMSGVFDEIKSSSIRAVKRLKQLGYPIIC